MELVRMIAEYMARGYLDNIVDMFKYDTSLYSLVGELLRDERLRVRLGVSALLEELHQRRPDEARLAVASLQPLLKDPDPTLRGDAAYLIGIVAGEEREGLLQPLLQDPDPRVVEVVREILAGD